MTLNAEGFTTPKTELKRFTLMGSTVDMWKAGVYLLSIMIMAFSGIWPYTKLLMMLVLFLLNSNSFSLVDVLVFTLKTNVL